MRISFTAAAEPETELLESEARLDEEATPMRVRKPREDYIPGSRIIRL